MNLFNIYGMDILLNNPKLVEKEIDYGIFYLKPREKGVDFDKIMFLGDKYGKEAIEYLKNLELLSSRVLSLFEVVPNELKPLLKKYMKK